jgi:hypothetical protein
MLKTMTGETILWHGQPNYPRWYIVPVLYVTVFLSWIRLDPSRFSSTLTSPDSLNGGTFIIGLLVLVWLRMVFRYGGVHYYVTDRRIVRKQDLPILRTVKEIPLEEIAAVKSKRHLGMGFIVFVSSKAFPLGFDNLSDDANSLQNLVETARQRKTC